MNKFTSQAKGGQVGSKFSEKGRKQSARGMGSGEGECILHSNCTASLRQHFLSTFS